MQARYNGTYVAVKQLKSSDQIALGDFRTEMSTLRRLHHPNAVQFLGACTRAQPYLIVTELMSCSLSTAFTLTFSLTLRRQVRSSGRRSSGSLPPRRAACHPCLSPCMTHEFNIAESPASSPLAGIAPGRPTNSGIDRRV